MAETKVPSDRIDSQITSDISTNQSNITTLQGNVQDYSTAEVRNLRGNRNSVSAVSYTADLIILEDTSGNKIRFTSMSELADITNSGAGGLDTGSEASDTWYHVWAISNGSVIDLLLSTSDSSPTMPSGYTYKKYISAVYNDSSSDFRNFMQVGNQVTYSLAVTIATISTWGSNVTNVSCSVAVPSTSFFGKFGAFLSFNYSAAGMRSGVVRICPGGFAAGTGSLIHGFFDNQWYQNAAGNIQLVSDAITPLNGSQQIDYYAFTTALNLDTRTGSIRVTGFFFNNV